MNQHLSHFPTGLTCPGCEEIGDLAYLQLESAKRLLLSFRITVAETLSFFAWSPWGPAKAPASRGVF